MGAGRETLALRAVIFDYGMVLTGPQEPKALATLLRITGLPQERFEQLYWANRHAYDEGKLTGLAFWQRFIQEAGLNLSQGTAEKLNLWDARMWTTQNPAMLAWQRKLKQKGMLTAILSNMGDNVHDNITKEFEWLRGFDVLVWSYQLHVAKPDPAIYLHTLKELGTRAEETLFLDDKQVNIQAAQALGFKTIQFTTVERLRADLRVAGLDTELPLP
jgi:putative hydrolase of the HAD superfamily